MNNMKYFRSSDRRLSPVERMLSSEVHAGVEMMATSEAMTFARTWVMQPRKTGAILPSGHALSQLITSEINPNSGPVLELGPGTGVFTRALLARGVKESNLILVESAPEFARLLQLRFPQATVLSIDARKLDGNLFTIGTRPSAAISGLPLLSMSAENVEAILSSTFAQISSSACLYQFTYGPACPVPRAILNRLYLVAERLGWTLFNLPPASVYRIRRR
jgi:phosphatidylethanolamine/phosphatidyl-N-methylethanolamine N-methyltransferase